MFEACKYRVIQIDGDYAHLQKIGEETEEPKLVARALLPAEIREGSIVIYEMLQYRLED
ncbi:MAG: chorismate--pyruvate lyase [Lachnospiraceae bacterium]|nr:chorismate--pyruvate lyase [Lachnospiraceae bacterium]